MNHVNTRLPGDFGLHVEGCRDIKTNIRAERIQHPGDLLDLPDIDACKAWLTEDMIAGGFEPDSAAAFDLHVYPCAKLAEDAAR